MLDHIGIDVSNLEASKAFFLEALAPLGPPGRPPGQAPAVHLEDVVGDPERLVLGQSEQPLGQ